MCTRVLVLGGYGNFGKRICENLAKKPSLTLIIAGRNTDKLRDMQRQLQAGNASAVIETACLDGRAANFESRLRALKPQLLIHTAGPFQGQDYSVPLACISAACHYIDLADDRRFVCDIVTLDRQAKEQSVLLVSGASSVPGLSSAVVEQYASEFQSLNSIDIGIAPGNQAERGLATLRAVLSYTGHAISVFSGGRWVRQYGWMSARRWGFGAVTGRRWLANVDVPDLELFPARFKVRERVRFQAGLELSVLHLAMTAMAQLSKWGWVKDWSRHADKIFKASQLFDALGSDVGGMRIQMRGIDHEQKPKALDWLLCAEGGVGPYIPTLAAVILANKLLDQQLSVRGAMPCLSLFSLQEFDDQARPLGIQHGVESNCG